MGILVWDKPQKQMTTEEWQNTYIADGAPPGVYVPNMAREDVNKWKAKLVGTTTEYPRVEIRKGTTALMLIIVSLGQGFQQKYKGMPEGTNVQLSMNGASAMTWQEWAEFGQAFQLGAAFIYTVGARYSKQSSDTMAAYRHIPLYQYETFEQFQGAIPYDCPLIGIEFGGESLDTYKHPERAVYLLGAEDHGLPDDVLAKCHARLTLSAVRQLSFNVSTAGAIVMYDRLAKALASG